MEFVRSESVTLRVGCKENGLGRSVERTRGRMSCMERGRKQFLLLRGPRENLLFSTGHTSTLSRADRRIQFGLSKIHGRTLRGMSGRYIRGGGLTTLADENQQM